MPQPALALLALDRTAHQLPRPIHYLFRSGHFPPRHVNRHFGQAVAQCLTAASRSRHVDPLSIRRHRGTNRTVTRCFHLVMFVLAARLSYRCHCPTIDSSLTLRFSVHGDSSHKKYLERSKKWLGRAIPHPGGPRGMGGWKGWWEQSQRTHRVDRIRPAASTYQ